MPCQKSDELKHLVDEAKRYTKDGKVADYIPELGKADPMERGFRYVFERVGMEPTGDPFNSIAKLETMAPAKPLNPIINAGALVVTHMIKGDSLEDRFNRLLDFIRELAGDPSVGYSEKVARSEFESANLNRALCYFLKQHNIITEDVETLLDLYTKQCAVEMNCLDLARIGMIFALDGVDSLNGKRIMPENVARICKTFMVTCGMYNASGELAIKIGIPAKECLAESWGLFLANLVLAYSALH